MGLWMSDRVLLLSWEYPPVIEGGLARHVRKLAEALVRRGVEVDVLTRGAGEGSAEISMETRGGVSVYRVPEPGWPRDLDRFVAWVERMNDDMLAAGLALAGERSYDLIHGHDWLVAQRLHGRSPIGWRSPTRRPSTRPSTAVIRAGCRTSRRRTSIRSSARWLSARHG